MIKGDASDVIEGLGLDEYIDQLEGAADRATAAFRKMTEAAREAEAAIGSMEQRMLKGFRLGATGNEIRH